jgi:hypothetical protein
VVDTLKHTAAEFDAEAAPLSSFMLNGQDYSKERSLRVRHQFNPLATLTRMVNQRLESVLG